jgi:UDP-N-acetylglucosamine--N-acetylmuramyl-(pentapeptide) pyrophosphoryl-undecaprenol N-acetylglucosamine transferase
VHFAAHEEVSAGPLHGVSLLQMLKSTGLMAAGVVQALRLMVKHRPAALLLTGGWVGLPVALAARMRGVPSLIYLPDIEPGLAIRRLEPLAQRVAVTVADSAAYFPRKHKIVVTGYPIRSGMRAAAREAGRAHFGLDPARPVLLVFGPAPSTQPSSLLRRHCWPPGCRSCT